MAQARTEAVAGGDRAQMSQEGGRIRIHHVLECGALTGCPRMVATICGALSPARYDLVLVFGLRPDIQKAEFEAIFPSYVRKVYVPEMVREICPGKDLAALKKLMALFRADQPAAVHAHSSKAGILARVAAWAAGVPRIFYSPHGYSVRMTDASLLARGLYFSAEWAASRIGRIIVNGPGDLVWAHRLAPTNRILPYYNGINVDAYEPVYAEARGQTVTVAACGRVTRAKNPPAFLRLVARFGREAQPMRFVWIGGGSKAETQAFEEYAKELGVNENIRITGWLPREQAIIELAKVDIVVHYSEWDVTPTVVLEAMALGKPVVGSPAADQIIHEETGLIAMDENELYRHTVALIESFELRRTLGIQARKAVEADYSLTRLVQQLEVAYRGVGCVESQELC